VIPLSNNFDYSYNARNTFVGLKELTTIETFSNFNFWVHNGSISSTTTNYDVDSQNTLNHVINGIIIEKYY